MVFAWQEEVTTRTPIATFLIARDESKTGGGA
jgi:hypothetical protein